MLHLPVYLNDGTDLELSLTTRVSFGNANDTSTQQSSVIILQLSKPHLVQRHTQ